MEITKWEYEYLDANDKTKLLELGKKGWEAFAADNGMIRLKRPCGRLAVIEKVNGVEINNEQNSKSECEDFDYIPKYDYCELRLDGAVIPKFISNSVFSCKTRNPDYFLNKMKELGNQGWQLCGVLNNMQSGKIPCEKH